MPRPRPGSLMPSDTIERIGLTGPGMQDTYHFLLTIPLPTLLAIIGVAYLFANVIFATGYFLIGGVANLQQDSFADCIFFSVQTMATIGYGNLYPEGFWANVLTTIETVFGLLVVALSSGIMFARFSRPTARVMFSKVAVITTHDGKQTLMFRVANQRRDQIAEARISVSMLRDEKTIEGYALRRFRDLQLERSQTPIFALSWTVMHVIDDASPLWAMTAEMLIELDVLLICSLTGIEETFVQTVHARHAYKPEDIRWNRRFADVVRSGPRARTIIDYGRFHEIEDVAPAVDRS